MNPADLPREVTATPPPNGDALLAAVRAVAQGPLQQQVEAIDRQGHYPAAVLQQLGAGLGRDGQLPKGLKAEPDACLWS